MLTPNYSVSAIVGSELDEFSRRLFQY